MLREAQPRPASSFCSFPQEARTHPHLEHSPKRPPWMPHHVLPRWLLLPRSSSSSSPLAWSAQPRAGRCSRVSRHGELSQHCSCQLYVTGIITTLSKPCHCRYPSTWVAPRSDRARGRSALHLCNEPAYPARGPPRPAPPTTSPLPAMSGLGVPASAPHRRLPRCAQHPALVQALHARHRRPWQAHQQLPGVLLSMHEYSECTSTAAQGRLSGHLPLRLEWP